MGRRKYLFPVRLYELLGATSAHAGPLGKTKPPIRGQEIELCEVYLLANRPFLLPPWTARQPLLIGGEVWRQAAARGYPQPRSRDI